MKLISLIAFILLSSCTLMAPQVRTVYIHEGVPVMLREDVSNVDVWTKLTGGKPVASTTDLEEGWM